MENDYDINKVIVSSDVAGITHLIDGPEPVETILTPQHYLCDDRVILNISDFKILSISKNLKMIYRLKRKAGDWCGITNVMLKLNKI